MKRSLYQMLNLAETATPEQIEAACAQRLRVLAAKVQQGDLEASNDQRLLQDGRVILLNPASRARYDQRLLDPNSTLRVNLALLPERDSTRGRPLASLMLLVIVGVVFVSVVYRPFMRKLEEIEVAHKTEVTRQRNARAQPVQDVTVATQRTEEEK